MDAPVLCARYDRFDIYFEGYGWDLPRTSKMMENLEESRYADICGTDIAGMADVGWQFTAEPVCFTAENNRGNVVAIAWAAPMRTEDKRTGCNLTYAVDAQYEGRGLATLLTAIAFLAADQLHPQMRFANIECRTDNKGSIAVAKSLGLARHPEEDFSMPVSGKRKKVAFYCFRKKINKCRQSALRVLEKKNMDELLRLIKKTAKQNF